MSPLGAVMTSFGSLNVSAPVPATPALPSCQQHLAVGLNLNTWCPSYRLCCAARRSPRRCLRGRRGAHAGTQTCRRRSSRGPCPTPVEFEDRSAVEFEPSHEFAPQRSYAQTWPSGPMSTPAVDPHVRPSGSIAQFFTTFGFGFGSGLSAGSTTPLWVRTVAANAANETRATRTRVLKRLEGIIATSSAAAILSRNSLGPRISRHENHSVGRPRTSNAEPRTTRPEPKTRELRTTL